MINNLPANEGDARDVGSIPGLGRSSEEGNGNPPQYSCLKNSMDRGAWWAAIHGGCKKSDTTEKLSMRVSQVPREMEWTNAILCLELPDY